MGALKDQVMAKVRNVEEAVLVVFADDVAKLARQKAPVRKLYKQKRRKYKPASSQGNAYLAAAFEHAKRKGLIKTKAEAAAYAKYLRQYAQVKVQRKGSQNNPLRVGQNRNLYISKRSALNVVTKEPVVRFYSARGVGAKRYSKPATHGFRATKAQHGFTTNEATDAKLSPRGRYEVRSGRAVTINARTGAEQIGGRLRQSIRPGPIVDNGNQRTIAVATDVPYAIYVEFPTSHNAAQPFLLPALHQRKHDLRSQLEASLREAGLKKG